MLRFLFCWWLTCTKYFYSLYSIVCYSLVCPLPSHWCPVCPSIPADPLTFLHGGPGTNSLRRAHTHTQPFLLFTLLPLFRGHSSSSGVRSANAATCWPTHVGRYSVGWPQRVLLIWVGATSRRILVGASQLGKRPSSAFFLLFISSVRCGFLAGELRDHQCGNSRCSLAGLC